MSGNWVNFAPFLAGCVLGVATFVVGAQMLIALAIRASVEEAETGD